jgi:hypothetical protein
MRDKIKKPPFSGTLIFALLSAGIVMILTLYSFREIILPFAFDSKWVKISDLALSSYNKNWVFLIKFEFISTIVQIIGLIVIVLFFFARSKRFPLALIIYVMAKVLVLTVTYYFHTVFKGVPTPTIAVMTGSHFRAILVAAAWIPYFMLSEKVRDTFIY